MDADAPRTEPDETEDVSQLRWSLGIVLGSCVTLLPILVGAIDFDTTAIIAAIGALVVLPFWRYLSPDSTSRVAVVSFLAFIVGFLAVAVVFGRSGLVTYVGAWGTTLSVVRFLTGWHVRSRAGSAPHSLR